MKRIIVFWLLMSSMMVAVAQNVKEVTVSSSTSFDEPIEIACDEKGLTMNVRMYYDEDNDILSLSLVPNRPVIFYRQDVIYKGVFSSGRKMKTERFPYPVQVAPASKIKLQKTVYKQYPKKRKNHIYNRWIGNVSSGMTELNPIITEAGEAVPLITADSLFLRFKVDASLTKATFKIRNVQTVDLISKQKNGKTKYSISGEADLNTTFNITLQRDPCHGMSALLAAVSNRINEISKAYHNLLQACPDGVALSDEECAIFNEHRKFLEAQFPVLNIDTDCPDVRSACETYNSFIDSIQNAPCNVLPPTDAVNDLFAEEGRVSTDVLVNASRSLNSLALRMLVVVDNVEQRDLYYQGEQLIEEIQNLVKHNGVSGEDRERALKLLSEAVDFWHRIVVKLRF